MTTTTTTNLALRTWTAGSRHPAVAVLQRLEKIKQSSGLAHKDHARLHDGAPLTGGRT